MGGAFIILLVLDITSNKYQRPPTQKLMLFTLYSLYVDAVCTRCRKLNTKCAMFHILKACGVSLLFLRVGLADLCLNFLTLLKELQKIYFLSYSYMHQRRISFDKYSNYQNLHKQQLCLGSYT